MKTSLIITCYHIDEATQNLTRNCLESLKYGRPDEVLVVDDCSPLGIRLEDVVYHRRDVNGGFPECANSGFSLATGDILILSNNDVVYTPGWLEGILKPLKEGYDISSILVSDSDGYITEDKIEEDGSFGSLWAMKRIVYDTIGGFDERFKGGTFEDKDYFLRAKEAGFKIGKYHGAMVEHVGRATMDKVYPDREDFISNRERFKEKYGRII